jgi:hypothetical protein
MAALSDGDRVYAYRWEGGNMPNDVVSIEIRALALSPVRGAVIVRFFFKNHEDCEAAARAQKVDAF